MEGSKRIFFLVLGLLSITGYVNSSTESGGHSKSPHEDVKMKLEKLRTEREKLRQEIEEAAEKQEDTEKIQKDLNEVISEINKLEVHFRVVYREQLDAIARKTGDFEKENTALQKELEGAEKSHAEAVAKLESANKEDLQQIEEYQKELEKAAKEKDRIEKEITALTEVHYERQDRLAEEEQQLNKMKDDLTVQMKAAQNEHANIPVDIAQGNEINEIMRIVSKYASMENTPTKASGLLMAFGKLKTVYKTLFEEPQLPGPRQLKDMEDELTMTDLYTRSSVVKRNYEKTDLLDELSKKELADYTKEEIQKLQQINQDIAVTEKFLKEIASRISCLKAIREVSDLIKQIMKSQELGQFQDLPIP